MSLLNISPKVLWRSFFIAIARETRVNSKDIMRLVEGRSEGTGAAETRASASSREGLASRCRDRRMQRVGQSKVSML